MEPRPARPGAGNAGSRNFAHITGTPHVGFGFPEAACEVRMGWRLVSAAVGGGPELNLDGVRREATDGAAAEHGVTLRSSVSW